MTDRERAGRMMIFGAAIVILLSRLCAMCHGDHPPVPPPVNARTAVTASQAAGKMPTFEKPPAGVPTTPVLWVYGTAWCVPCQAMKPEIMAAQSAGHDVRYVDVTNRADLLATYRIERVPLLLMAVHGREWERNYGTMNSCGVRQWFERAWHKFHGVIGDDPQMRVTYEGDTAAVPQPIKKPERRLSAPGGRELVRTEMRGIAVQPDVSDQLRQILTAIARLERRVEAMERRPQQRPQTARTYTQPIYYYSTPQYSYRGGCAGGSCGMGFW